MGFNIDTYSVYIFMLGWGKEHSVGTERVQDSQSTHKMHTRLLRGKGMTQWSQKGCLNLLKTVCSPWH